MRCSSLSLSHVSRKTSKVGDVRQNKYMQTMVSVYIVKKYCNLYSHCSQRWQDPSPPCLSQNCCNLEKPQECREIQVHRDRPCTLTSWRLQIMHFLSTVSSGELSNKFRLGFTHDNTAAGGHTRTLVRRKHRRDIRTLHPDVATWHVCRQPPPHHH